MLHLYRPAFEELWFRQRLLADAETMAYNRAWGGTIPFPEECRRAWYDRWVADSGGKRFYRYLTDASGRFVGEAAWHWDDERGICLADVIVFAPQRGKGYGGEALELLCAEAKRAGVTRLCDDVAADNPAIALFRKHGFTEAERTERSVLLVRPLRPADADGGPARAVREPVCVALRERPEKKEAAAEWFHGKWGVPAAAYLACMDDYLARETEYGWYLCLDGGGIVGGLGVIENDFHDRKDLRPNICAVYTEEAYRRRGIAGRLLYMAVEDLRSRGVSPVYLVTDHTGFYERYGWEFLCMAQGDGEPEPTRMYIHR